LNTEPRQVRALGGAVLVGFCVAARMVAQDAPAAEGPLRAKSPAGGPVAALAQEVGRWQRGAGSMAAAAVAPLGGWWCPGIEHLATPDRLERGLILVLPGIEGRGPVNLDLARGLADGGVTAAIEVFDWTTGSTALALYHLRALERNRRVADEVARRIVEYQDQHPGRPVHLVGHSGGGGLAVLALEALPEGRTITSAVLLAPALSPRYDLTKALGRTERGIRHFHSRHDRLYLELGTRTFGTLDGHHATAAGAQGFRLPEGASAETTHLYATRLFQEPYRREMAASWNLGQHTGATNRVFAAEWIAPLLGPGQTDEGVRHAAHHDQ